MATPRRSFYKLGHAGLLFIAIIFVATATWAVHIMGPFQLGLSSTIVIVAYLIGFRRNWGTLFRFVRGGLFIAMIAELVLLSLAIIWDSPASLSWSRLVLQGVIGIALLMPVVFDSIAILTPRGNPISSLLEIFILLRNVLSGIAHEFFVGVITARGRSGPAGTIRRVCLSVEAIIARTPDLATNFGIASRISRLDIHNLTSIYPTLYRPILGFTVLVAYFSFCVYL